MNFLVCDISGEVQGRIQESDFSLVHITTITLEPKDQVNLQLKRLCPYLHYSQIDSRNEMTVCGAYLDRMVLGGQRLHEICETQEHLQCEYSLNPRCSS